jgi:integrase
MSVYKRFRKDGKSFTWWSRFRLKGRRYERRLPAARTRAQAIEDERKLIRSIEEGTDKAKGSISLKEFVEQFYLKWTKENKRSWQDDIYRLNPILGALGKKELREISPFDIERYKRQRQKTPITFKNKKKEVTGTRERSPGAVNRELALLSAIFRVAIKSKQVTTNPCHEVENLKGEKTRIRYLLKQEEERLLPQLTGDREHLRDMVILTINTGIRVGEMLNLKVEDVDLVEGKLILRETKNGESREVPLNRTARTLVENLVRKARERNRIYLFTNPDTGKKFTSIHKGWKKSCSLAKISDLRFHDLRHTFATRAVKNGAMLAEVKEVLGHKSIQMTERYTHATVEGKRRAVEAVENDDTVTTRAEEAQQRKLANR